MKKKFLLPLILIPFLLTGCGVKGDIGPAGPQGPQGIPGEKGDQGEKGVSITKVEKTSSEGNIDTYTISFSDGTSSTFNITNGNDGHSPSITIGTNGNWYIDNVDTGKSAKGEQGNPGSDGVSIISVALSGTEGLIDTYTITYSNGTTSSFTVTNGAQGEKGEQGDPGKDGTSMHNGNGVPSNDLGNNGDSYINLDNWDYYVKENGSWNKKGNIKGSQGEQGETGPQGEQGIAGKDGSSVHVGHGVPSSSLGKDGDSYINLYNWDYYVKEEGLWIKSGNISYNEKYTVKFMYGDEEISKSLEVTPNSRIPRPTISKYKGQPINYWYVEGYSDRPWEFNGYYADRVVDNVTLYAKLKDIVITLDPLEGGSVYPTTVSVSFDKPYSLPIPTTTAKKDGFSLVFDHWSANGNEIPLSGDSWPYGEIDNNTLTAEYVYGDDYTDTLYIIEGSSIIGIKDKDRTGEYVIPKTYNGQTIDTISEDAFLDSKLSSVVIPKTIKTIRTDAFHYCENLTSLYIPSTVEEIGNAIASICASLASISVDPNNKIYDSRNNCNAIIETSSNKLIQASNSTIIPNNIEIIGSKSFYNCCNKTTIDIPSSVNTIEEYGFLGSRFLTSIFIPAPVTTIGPDAFLGCFYVTIYCEASEKPAGWDDSWNSSDRPVVWGYNPNN